MQTDETLFPTLLDVTCCVRLHAVACCLEWLNFWATTPNISFVAWSPKRSATMLDTLLQFFQHCWDHAHASHMVSMYPSHDALHVPTLFNNVGSCCISLHATLLTLTQQLPNVVGPTMLGVVASVCASAIKFYTLSICIYICWLWFEYPVGYIIILDLDPGQESSPPFLSSTFVKRHTLLTLAIALWRFTYLVPKVPLIRLPQQQKGRGGK